MLRLPDSERDPSSQPSHTIYPLIKQGSKEINDQGSIDHDSDSDYQILCGLGRLSPSTLPCISTLAAEDPEVPMLVALGVATATDMPPGLRSLFSLPVSDIESGSLHEIGGQ